MTELSRRIDLVVSQLELLKTLDADIGSLSLGEHELYEDLLEKFKPMLFGSKTPKVVVDTITTRVPPAMEASDFGHLKYED